jgi:hypothetical protein
MHQLRKLIIVLVAILVLALAASALVTRPAVPAASDDDLVIKGGSLEIQCGKNHKNDNAGCLALDDGTTGKFKHKQSSKHITRVVVTSRGATVFDSDTLPADKKLDEKTDIVITYKETATQTAP